MTSPRRVEELAKLVLEGLRPKAKSLIVTVYGDAIAPHGGSAWLGSLIRIMEPFSLNERIVRTSVFRLAREQWLTSTQIGRRSYYSVTEIGRHRFAAAHQRIYGADGRRWDQQWTIVFTNLPGLTAEARESLRRDLGWLGFGPLVPGVMLHPDPDRALLRQALADAQAGESLLVMRGAAEPWIRPETLREVIRGCWGLDQLADTYIQFLDLFRPLWRAVDSADDLDPALCFQIRILLMHGYRRALLRDPMLPDELLPADWPGAAARLLCRNLYRRVQAPAERYLMAALETSEGPLPEAAPSYYARFGGLQDVA